MAVPRMRWVGESNAYIPAPVGGWNADTPPHEVPENQAPQLDNVLIRPGKIVPRGGFSVWADATAVTPLNVCGVHPHLGDSNLFISRKTISASAYVDPWNAPLVRPLLAATIATPVTTVQIAQGGTTLGTAVLTAGRVPGPRGITYEGVRYYISYGTSSAPVNDAGSTYFAQSTSLCTQTGASTFTEFTNAPHGAVDLRGYLQRLWLLAGIDTAGGGTTFSPLTLFFSNAPLPAGGGNTAASADWKDPVSGLSNKIQMDGDYTDPGIALAITRGALVILRYQSVWAVRGSTPASYTVVPISRETGCIDARSVVECDRGVYFLSRKGLMLTDGSSVRNLTGEQMMITLQNAIGVYLTNVLAGFGGYATCALCSDGKILVSIGIPSVTSGAPDGHVQPVWCGLFDPANGTWVRLTSPIWALDGTVVLPGNAYPGWVITTPERRVLTVGDKYVTQLEAPASTTFAPSSVTNSPTAATNDATVGVTAWTNPTNAEVQDSVYADVVGSTTSAQKLPGTAAQLSDGSTSAGTPAWSNISNITAYDGNSATCAMPDGFSNTLEATNYGFAIPSNAIILGVSVSIPRATSSPSTTSDRVVKLIKGGTISGTNHAIGGGWGVVTTASYGSSSDLWGLSLTPADVNASNFGLAIQLNCNSGNAFIDAIFITVTWILPTQYLKTTAYGFAIPVSAVINGIVATVRRTDLAGSGVANDLSLRLYKAGVLTGSDKASASAWPGSPASVTYGSASDLWGTTWAPADINGSTFGVAVAGGASAPGSPHWAVDWVGLTVFYTVGGATQSASFVQNPGLYDMMADGTFQPIPVTWKTRLFSLAAESSRKISYVRRWFVDYVMQGSGFLASRAWTITPADASGTAYSAPVPTVLGPNTVSNSVSGGNNNPSQQIQHQNQDLTNESTEIQFTVAWVDQQRASAPSGLAAEIHGIGVGYRPAQDLR